MDTLLRIDLNIFALLISLMILVDLRGQTEKKFIQNKLFLALLLSNILVLLLEIASWVFNGRPGAAWEKANLVANAVFYAANQLPPYIWVLYADYEVFKNENRIRRMAGPLALPVLIIALLVFTVPLNNWFFFIGSGNEYHRGALFPLLVVMCYAYFLAGFLIVFRNRAVLPKKHFMPLLIFVFPPVLGGLLQAFFYGLTLVWSGMTLSILYIYIIIQNKRLHTDYLTGVNNRMPIGQYLRQKVRESASGKGFSLLLIDIDGFKAINDEFGHAAGDAALTTTAELMRRSLRKDDFLARYGGDEFLIILDIQDQETLRKSVERIRDTFHRFNRTGVKPYELLLSIGYAVYDPDLGLTEDQFLQHVDALMYTDKKQRGGRLTAGLPL